MLCTGSTTLLLYYNISIQVDKFVIFWLFSEGRTSRHYVSCMDILGRRACCLAHLPNRTGTLGSAERDHSHVSFTFFMLLLNLYICTDAWGLPMAVITCILFMPHQVWIIIYYLPVGVVCFLLFIFFLHLHVDETLRHPGLDTITLVG